MGCGILTDGKTLDEFCVPRFDHPTPVNVALRLKEATALAPAKPKGEGGAKQAVQGSTGAREVSSGACRIL